MARRRLKDIVARFDTRPFHHLLPKRFRRREVVVPFSCLGARGLFLLRKVQAFCPVELGDGSLEGTVTRFAARAFSVHTHIGGAGILKSLDEGTLEAARLFTHGKVFGGGSPLGDGLGKGGPFPVRAGIQIPEQGIAALTGAEDAPFLLDGCHRLGGQTKVDQHALVFPRGIMQAQAGFSGIGLHDDDVRPAFIPLEIRYGRFAFLFGNQPGKNAGIGKGLLQRLHR